MIFFFAGYGLHSSKLI